MNRDYALREISWTWRKVNKKLVIFTTVSFFYLTTLVFGYLPALYSDATQYPITSHRNEHKTSFTVSNYPPILKLQALKENCDFLVELWHPLTFSAQSSYPGSQNNY